MTQEEFEELIDRTIKEQKGRVMSRHIDRPSHPFTPEILAVTVPPHVQNPQIDSYRGKIDLVEHIQRHDATLLGRNNNDNHFVLLFRPLSEVSFLTGCLVFLRLRSSRVGT